VGKDREFFENFLVFTIFGPVFRSWLSTVLGRSLDPLAALEIARYQEGDFIVPHSDFIDSKVLGVNIYLDKDWNAKKGGCLNFINGAGQTYALEPRYNSLSLIPIAHDCFHSVAPWKSTRPGRYTVSLGYRLPEPTSATGLDELRN
jgi:Rps23 Pro-64 3,4-dihydroxylase Tpa1-like proline 4-hydroxylase